MRGVSYVTIVINFRHLNYHSTTSGKPTNQMNFKFIHLHLPIVFFFHYFIKQYLTLYDAIVEFGGGSICLWVPLHSLLSMKCKVFFHHVF